MLLRWTLAFIVGTIAFPSTTVAAPTTLTFETLHDGELVTAQFTGLTFANAITLTAGVSLNEFEFPPHSGVNVIGDVGGPISITFATPVNMVSGYFTYSTRITMRAFDASGTLLASIPSARANNEALSGDPGSAPNELLSLAFAGITKVTITGNPVGGSFVLDDFTYNTGVPVPVAPVWVLLMLGVLLVYVAARRLGARAA